MKKRNHTFDLLCGLCILRMIMLHTVSTCGLRGEFWFGKLMAWTFFFMSFFFFKAGYFNKGVVGNYRLYVKDRVKRLLVPYLVWGGIGSAVFFGFICTVPALKPVFNGLNWEHLYRQSPSASGWPGRAIRFGCRSTMCSWVFSSSIWGTGGAGCKTRLSGVVCTLVIGLWGAAASSSCPSCSFWFSS